MQDLYIIQKQNAEAAQRELARSPKGRYSVAEYAGLHFVKYHYADDHDTALAIAAGINARGDSSHAKAPSEHPIAADRDSIAAH